MKGDLSKPRSRDEIEFKGQIEQIYERDKGCNCEACSLKRREEYKQLQKEFNSIPNSRKHVILHNENAIWNRQPSFILEEHRENKSKNRFAKARLLISALFF